MTESNLLQLSKGNITLPLDICYTASSRCLDYAVNYHPMEDEEIFMRIHPDKSVEGEVRTRYHQIDTFSMSFREWDEIKRRRILKDIKVDQLFGVLNRLGLDFVQFIEEAHYGNERTELRRAIERLNEAYPPRSETRQVLAVTNSINGQKAKEIFFMHQDYRGCSDNYYRKYFFTPCQNGKSYPTIEHYSFDPNIWQFPSREHINASLENAIECARLGSLFDPVDECRSLDEPEPGSLEHIEQCTKTIENVIPEAMRLLFGLPKPTEIEYIEGETSVELSNKTLMLQDVNRQLRNRKT